MEEQNNQQVGYPNKNGSYGKRNSRTNSNDLSSVVFGKLPPQSLDLEETVLGGILIDHEAFPKIVEVLKAECFYTEAHQVIFSAAKALFQATQPIDRLTVFEQMQRMGTLDRIGGNPYYLVQLTEKVASSAHIESHARLILQKYVLREMIGISTEVITDAYAGTTDPLTLLDKAQQNLFNINQISLSRSFEGLNTLAGKLLKHLEQLREQGGMTGITSGMPALDAVTSGWQRSDLIIIAARPAMGKTAFTLSLAHNAAKAGFPVAIFSLEMANLQLVQRLLSLEGNIEGGRMRDGKLSSEDWEKLPNAIDRLSRLPIYIDDTPGINIFELRAKCRRLKAQHKIEMVIIDYLQLMTAGEGNRGGNREQEISMISRSLKGLAKELNVPVLALSQLSRAVETRGGSKKPQLSDLRESGAIEQDSDIVSFIYRPEYYQLTEYEDGTPTKGMADIIIAKHRNGNVGEVRLKFEGQYSRFADPNDGNGHFTEGDPNVITISSRMNSMDNDFDLSKVSLSGTDAPAKTDFPYGTTNLPRSPLDLDIGLNPNARPEDGFSPF
jgi:replicative DNA helicase